MISPGRTTIAAVVKAGAVLGGRFVVEEQIGAGGMGLVYRARDLVHEVPVAVKILRARDAEGGPRLAREARVLSELARLSHPAIVRHVADGVLPDGALYLAMQWLEGVDLRARLLAGPLALPDVLRLGRRVAEGLAAAHERGVVHRDLKPSNIYLPAGSAAGAVVLDFGVAHVTGDLSGAGAGAGTIVGTPAYMSPEQARGAPVDARADLFSLGCVLHECLAGAPPFTRSDGAASAIAVLARILLEDAPRLTGVPAAVEELVARLLEKERARRPPDAGTVAAELGRILAALDAGTVPTETPAESALTPDENRVVSVVLARHGRGDAVDVAALARRHGLRLEALVDGSMVAVLSGAGAATDLCARAARFARGLLGSWPDASVALATGRGQLRGALPLGEVIDRAAGLLAGGEPGPPLRLDEISAGLLAITRPLLGKATPCVGRERELATLEATFRESATEEVARAVLVTGPAGVGKSRLLRELETRLRQEPGIEVWHARGEPMRQGAPFGLLAGALRRAAGIREGDPPEEARRRLAARVGRCLAGDDAARVTEFLGELSGVPFPDDGREQLRAARGNAQLLGDQMRRAWEELVLAETAAGPVVLFLEDLHQGDLPTVKAVDAALRLARERPLFVLALGRPEVETVFPGLWAQRQLLHLRLGELSRRASERLVRAVLGETVADTTVARVVAQSGGNAFYLEELIRAVSLGRPDELPGSVVAMAQTRLEALPESARRLLRAGSVFGATFTTAGVATLLGAVPGELTAELERMVELELLQVTGDRWGFRHDLLREAAYAMLTDRDRALGHRLAAEWCERAGERDALVLAAHHERGGARGPAAAQYRRAAEHALEASDLEAVLERAARSIACGAEGPALAAVRLLEATAFHWRAEYGKAEQCATEALRDLPPLGAPWYRAIEELAEASLPRGDVAQLVVLGDALRAPPAGAESLAAFVVAAATVAMQLLLAGEHAAAERVLARLAGAAGRLGDLPPLCVARTCFARATRAMVAGDIGAVLEEATRAVAAYERAGDLRNVALLRTNLGAAYVEVGAYAEAGDALRAALAAAERTGLPAVAAYARENLALALGRQGEHREAAALAAAAATLFEASGDRRNLGLSRIYLAAARLGLRALEPAERAATAAIEALAGVPPARADALATLAAVLLEAGRDAEALEAVSEAATLLSTLGGIDEGEALLRLVHARALARCGRSDEARTAATAARARLVERAGKITDERWRASFLERVPEHAATMTMTP